jgi:hypothetical protein
MAKIWRRVVLVAAAAGLIGAGATSAIAASASATPAVSVAISATSPHYPGAINGKVDGYAVVVYKDRMRARSTGVVSGQVTGASGDVAELLAEPFGTTKFTATGLRKKLSASPARYDFDVLPSVETRYEVQVSTSGKVVATSVSATVWVTDVGIVSDKHKTCSPAAKPVSCAVYYQVREKIPAAAYATEAGKHFYLYQAVGYPGLPDIFTLAKTAGVSKVRKIYSGEFEVLLTFHIPLSHHAGTWLTTFCTRDTESSDGLGLPGHHGCGNWTVTVSAIYLG